ncbi:hypothetical protein [Kitasatospora aureofaciens]|uniref:hypothetical protein n=1 Tax=Kitasatospora aureofaciens TaxID=1894 RepID=UPI0037C8BD8A
MSDVGHQFVQDRDERGAFVVRQATDECGFSAEHGVNGSLDERVAFGREFHQDGSAAGGCRCSSDEAVAFGSGDAL